MTELSPLPSDVLPAGIRARFVPGSGGAFESELPPLPRGSSWTT